MWRALERAQTQENKKGPPHKSWKLPGLKQPNMRPLASNHESAKGAGGKGARVINCHNFFFTPDRETRRIDHTTTEGTAERKMRQFATPGSLYAGPLSALLIETSTLGITRSATRSCRRLLSLGDGCWLLIIPVPPRPLLRPLLFFFSLSLYLSLFLFRVSPSTVGTWKSDWENRWDLIRSHSGNQSGEPTVLGDSLRASPSTVGRVIGKTDGP